MYLNRSGPYKRVPTEDLDELVEEGTIWSYIIQISNAMKAVHDGGMALRILDPTKVLMTSKGRYVILNIIALFGPLLLISIVG